jgi:murein DD-endopeptidase MepM/ murein hydrolase activator NlpD
MRNNGWWIVGLTGLLLLFLWLAGPLAEQVAAAPSIQEEVPVEHVVQAGETLFRIAQQYDTTVEAIVAVNDIADPGYIEVGQKLIIPAAGAEGSTAAEGLGSVTSYIVVPGDTLEAVARRFNTTATAIAESNGVVSPMSLEAGGQLRVPGHYVGPLLRVGANETAWGLAMRYNLPIWEFLADNGLSSAGALLPGQRVWIPGEVLTGTLPLPFVGLDVGPIPVLQGHTVRVKADLVPGAVVTGVFDGQALNFAAEGDTHYALFGIHALAEPGTYTVALLASEAEGAEAYVTQSIEIVDGGYDYEEIVLTAERDAMLDPQALAIERERLAGVKATFNPQRYWDGLFLRPIDTELTSFFGTRRLYKSPSYQSYGYHEGTDFDGEIGTPVYAPAPGVVVLAEPLFVRGNAVVIDHGWGIYTGYWHLSQIDVSVGQKVEPGNQIGLVGDTGLSTGAHLHWDFWVNGTNVSALQWTEQPFP